MSYPATCWAWTVVSELPPTAGVVLLLYAHVADREGRGARLRLETLQERTGRGRSTLLAARSDLIARRLLRLSGETSGGVPIYDLPVDPATVDQLELDLGVSRGQPLIRAVE